MDPSSSGACTTVGLLWLNSRPSWLAKPHHDPMGDVVQWLLGTAEFRVEP
jgi:hypothetical protein